MLERPTISPTIAPANPEPRGNRREATKAPISVGIASRHKPGEAPARLRHWPMIASRSGDGRAEPEGWPDAGRSGVRFGNGGETAGGGERRPFSVRPQWGQKRSLLSMPPLQSGQRKTDQSS